MAPLTRRSFVSQAAAGLALAGAFGEVAPRAEAQLVWKSSDWKLGEFRDLLETRARIRQVYDVVRIGDGKFLNNIKNSLNGLRFGFDIPEGQIRIAAALHGPANMINYDDYVWNKYQIGEWLEVTDPETGKPAVRNIYFPATAQAAGAGAAPNPDDPKSMYQDSSVENLQKRGVRFLSCHTATEEQTRALIRHSHLTQAPEEIVQDMLAHALPGVLVVASMVAAIALLQAEGRFTYITV